VLERCVFEWNVLHTTAEASSTAVSTEQMFEAK
jgi:hypothetical protein